MKRFVFGAALLLLLSTPAFADGPADNLPDQVRRIPKLGIDVPADKRGALEQQLTTLKKAIAQLQRSSDARTLALLPDVQIYDKAVGDALKYQEFFDVKEIDMAFELLKEGQQRAESLVKSETPWTTARGLVVRGYVSRIDGSVQPYGLVIPESYSFEGAHRYRLDIWFHGRGETLSELNFIQQRQRQVGTFAPADTIVLHPYGRYSNAFKFAGETDVLEALESTRRRYRIDDDRTSVRGFSMGGAACWQFAVHYADRWFAANPGAGFSETPEFLRTFQQETLDPTWYERKLWHWYDCTDWAANLHNCPTVAYSGELDSQKQAADIMQQALAQQRLDLVHIIGPQTKHAYHPEARDTVDRLLASIADRGRQRLPHEVRFTTYTLKYNRMSWVTIDGISEHWQQSRVDAKLGPSFVLARTQNVTDLTLDMPAGWAPFDSARPVEVRIDGETLETFPPRSDRSWKVQLHSVAGSWQLGARPVDGLRKHHDLQGPVDDAFMDSFIFVRPTGKARHESVEKWTAAELTRAIEHWRRHFRGEARVKDDRQISDDDIASSNLILWGDPSSNAVLSRIADKLPIRWTSDAITVGERRFAADHHAPILIYPNPLNPKRYVVLNSSFTFREYAYLNNARQVPKLPDWAIVDLTTPPNTLWPGKIAAADFFNESWQLRSPRE
jgi:dienelactone hydrolase